jgi:putative endonuclease
MPPESPFFVYVLRNDAGTTYTGIAKDIDARLAAHNEGNGAKFTRGRGPWAVIHTEGPLPHGDALRRETAIKRDRAFKAKLKERGRVADRPSGVSTSSLQSRILLVNEENTRMQDKSYLRTLIDFNAWANEEMYQKVSELPPEEMKKERPTPLVSIYVSLHHLLNVDEIWLGHMTGGSHDYKTLRDVKIEDLDELWAARKAMDKTLQDYVDGLSDAELAEIVNYELLGGNKGSMSRLMCLTHLAMHGAYHRGWISDMFGQAGAQQPSIDIPVYERALREGGLPPMPV